MRESTAMLSAQKSYSDGPSRKIEVQDLFLRRVIFHLIIGIIKTILPWGKMMQNPKVLFSTLVILAPSSAISYPPPTAELEKAFIYEVRCDSLDEREAGLQGYRVDINDSGSDELLDRFTVSHSDTHCNYTFHAQDIRQDITDLVTYTISLPPDLPAFGVNYKLEAEVLAFIEANNAMPEEIHLIKLKSLDPLNPEYSLSLTAFFHEGELISASISSMDEKMEPLETFVIKAPSRD